MRLFSLLFVVIVFVTQPIAAAQSGHSEGKALHDRYCLACHGTEVYTRKDRSIHSMEALQAQVRHCAKNAAKVQWEQNQIDAVAEYLGATFYGF